MDVSLCGRWTCLVPTRPASSLCAETPFDPRHLSDPLHTRPSHRVPKSPTSEVRKEAKLGPGRIYSPGHLSTLTFVQEFPSRAVSHRRSPTRLTSLRRDRIRLCRQVVHGVPPSLGRGRGCPCHPGTKEGVESRGIETPVPIPGRRRRRHGKHQASTGAASSDMVDLQIALRPHEFSSGLPVSHPGTSSSTVWFPDGARTTVGSVRVGPRVSRDRCV